MSLFLVHSPLVNVPYTEPIKPILPFFVINARGVHSQPSLYGASPHPQEGVCLQVEKRPILENVRGKGKTEAP